MPHLVERAHRLQVLRELVQQLQPVHNHQHRRVLKGRLLRQAPRAEDRFRVIAYDSVNHGHSSNSPRGEDEPDRADELEGFLAALGIERPILAGNSMGALTILRWATRHPDDAAALIPSGMGVMAPGSDAMPQATRRALFEPVGENVLFLDAQGGFNPGYADAEPVEYQRYVRLRATATRISCASRSSTRMCSCSPLRRTISSFCTGCART